MLACLSLSGRRTSCFFDRMKDLRESTFFGVSFKPSTSAPDPAALIVLSGARPSTARHRPAPGIPHDIRLDTFELDSF